MRKRLRLYDDEFIKRISYGTDLVDYQYDKFGRLIREDNSSFDATTLFEYDNKGNILKKTVYPYTSEGELPAATEEHIYDYTGNSYNRLSSYDGEANVYDALGNPTTYRGKAAEWGKGRKLKSYNGTTFTYDGLGRRNGKGDWHFYYDSEDNLVKMSRDTDKIEFLYDEQGLVGMIRNGYCYIYQLDAQGNVIAILDFLGRDVVQYDYDAWGNYKILYDRDNIGDINPFKYRSYFYDVETGLYYLQSRYYDPEVGRFINQDSVDYADPETINGLNLYAYCGNNPVMNVDPTGCFLDKLWSGYTRLVGGFALTVAGGITTLVTTPLALLPGCVQPFERSLSTMFYGAALTGSVFDSVIYKDMENIYWNPYNTDETATLGSQKMSFYKGVPVIRANFKRSGTFGIMVSKGNATVETVKHEYGHILQLMALGAFNFLFTVGIPSMAKLGVNEKWLYYHAPWEAMAEVLGGANSDSKISLTAADKKRAYRYFYASYILGPFAIFAVL